MVNVGVERGGIRMYLREKRECEAAQLRLGLSVCMQTGTNLT